MTLSIEQNSFIRELITTGDEVLVCRRIGIDPVLILDWEREYPIFKLKYNQAVKKYLSNIENAVARGSLNSLNGVLKYGERTVTNCRTQKQALGFEGEIIELETVKVTQKVIRNVAWAVKEGIRIYLLKRLEDSVSAAITTLVNENIIPESIKDQILSIIEASDNQVQAIFAGDLKNVEISESALAEIQSLLLGN